MICVVQETISAILVGCLEHWACQESGQSSSHLQIGVGLATAMLPSAIQNKQLRSSPTRYDLERDEAAT